MLKTNDTILSIKEKLLEEALLIHKNVAWWEMRIAKCIQNIEKEEKKLLPDEEKIKLLYNELKTLIQRASIEDKNISTFINKYKIFFNEKI
jgi:hypothetical protein